MAIEVAAGIACAKDKGLVTGAEEKQLPPEYKQDLLRASLGLPALLRLNH